MKTKDKKELFTKTTQELQHIVGEAREKVFSLRLQAVQNKLKNKREVFLKRKDIARILTVIRQKEQSAKK